MNRAIFAIRRTTINIAGMNHKISPIITQKTGNYLKDLLIRGNNTGGVHSFVRNLSQNDCESVVLLDYSTQGASFIISPEF